MKIAFLDVSGVLFSEAARLISALLKQEGHSVKIVYFARRHPIACRESELEQLDAVLAEVDLVLVAVYSLFAPRAIQTTRYVRRRYPSLPVIWGGPHCVATPEIGLRHADGVCFAEGDEAVVELVNKMAAGEDHLKTRNMAFKVDGNVIKNPVRPPLEELDGLPTPDLDLTDMYLLAEDLSPLTERRFLSWIRQFGQYPIHRPTYYTLTSRGCPHHCSYCNNARYIALHGKSRLRFRSVDNIIGGLEETLQRMPFFDYVFLSDDDFLARPLKEIEDFKDRYRKRIGLPLITQLSANTFSREKIEMLLEAGLTRVQMGVQSGSQRVLEEVFDRSVKVSKALTVIKQLEPYMESHNLDVAVDLIVDNPYETKADILETFRVMVALPRSVSINMYLLSLLPGTPLYERAIQDGIVSPQEEDRFRSFGLLAKIKHQQNYETLLLFLLHHLRQHRLHQHIPQRVLSALGSRLACGVGAIPPARIYRAIVGYLRRRELRGALRSLARDPHDAFSRMEERGRDGWRPAGGRGRDGPRSTDRRVS